MYFRRNPHDMDRATFVATFGDVYESSPWVAEKMWQTRDLTGEVESFAAGLAAIVDKSSHEQRLALLRAHPDLAGRAALAGELTTASTDEQASAGLDRCSAEELQQFQELNRRYKGKFGFPFVLAVKGASRQKILEIFGQRIENDADSEFTTAINEVHKIARLRLQEIAGHA